MRKVAGWYWLVDTEQAGMPYKAPLRTNELGNSIWEMLQRGYSKERIVEILVQEYEAPRELLEKDVEQFLLSYQKFSEDE